MGQDGQNHNRKKGYFRNQLQRKLQRRTRNPKPRLRPTGLSQLGLAFSSRQVLISYHNRGNRENQLHLFPFGSADISCYRFLLVQSHICCPCYTPRRYCCQYVELYHLECNPKGQATRKLTNHWGCMLRHVQSDNEIQVYLEIGSRKPTALKFETGQLSYLMLSSARQAVFLAIFVFAEANNLSIRESLLFPSRSSHHSGRI